MVSSATAPQSRPGLIPDEREAFRRDGFLILRGLATPDDVAALRAVAVDHLQRQRPPLEYEADLHYPGAPASRNAEGGRTVRRLLQAQGRDPAFTQWIMQPALVARLHALLGSEVFMPLAHHNCIMTKQPRFSSDTGWHQDIRYWAFERAELINVWLALGPERRENGCLRLIPGSHQLELKPERFDPARFLREDLAENLELLRGAIHAELDAGDVLMFHCRTLHAATRNYADETKYSAVFTFRAGDDRPLPGTRSASLPELLLP